MNTMKRFSKITALAFVLVTVISMVFAGAAWASVADQINAWNANILGNALTVDTSVSGKITVTGTVTGVTQGLEITDNDTVDIIWKAVVEGENVDRLIFLDNNPGSPSGRKDFIVESGGKITGGHEALLTLSGFNIIVKNGGLVK
ncbi:MAG: hypothetical protein LBU26_04390, partial [Synergistaceae bacterium]|nr:hypothetical protein [Synergistaceae bacterium]